jgi:excisionase family DNA binding protein
LALLLPYQTAELPPMSNFHNEFEPRFGRSVSIDQAAQLLSVSRRTVYNRIKDGRLKTIRTAGGSRRVLLESLYDLGFRPQAFPTSASAATFSIRSVR